MSKDISKRGRVLFISNIAWDFIWQRHQTLAALFAQDYDAVFLELPGIRRIGWRDAGRLIRRAAALMRGPRPEVFVISRVRILRPWVVPASNGLFRAWNRWVLARALREWHTGVDIVVNYSPTFTALTAARLVPHTALVYDCTDNWSSVPGVPVSVLRAEQEWLRCADLTIVPSRALQEQHARSAKRLERLPHGALVERFAVVEKMPSPAKQTTLLYYGHLHRQHLDFEAIAGLARLRPNWRIILVGPIKTPGIFPANVELVGQQPHEALAGWIAQAHLLLLPYVLNSYTEAVMPAKTYECLATGRPIVAAPLPELIEGFADYMRFARTAEEYVAMVEATLSSDDLTARAGRMALARENSWASRYRTLRVLLEEIQPKAGS